MYGLILVFRGKRRWEWEDKNANEDEGASWAGVSSVIRFGGKDLWELGKNVCGLDGNIGGGHLSLK